MSEVLQKLHLKFELLQISWASRSGECQYQGLENVVYNHEVPFQVYH
jgi:hypothetical protein